MKHQIKDEILVCPYCMNEVRPNQMKCCGESSCHFEIVYVTHDLESETEVKES